jgi:hypothetical protein
MKKIPTTLLFPIIAFFLFLGTGKCFGQDSIQYENIIIVQRISSAAGQKDTLQRFFTKGNRVKVTGSNHNVATGKIQKINDSSILVKDKEFKIKDITRIHLYRGTEPAIAGSSLALVGGAMMIYSHYNQLNQNNNNQESYLGWWDIVGLCSVVVGGGTTLFGLIEIASTKYYRIGTEWKLRVISEPVKEIIRLKLLNQHNLKK